VLILALETGTPRASVAIAEGDEELASWREETRRDLCRRLASELAGVLGGAGREPGDISLVAVGKGPGSFTSLRVGMATAKAFAAARDIPLVGVPSLQAMAWQVRSRVDGLACPVLDAGREQLYAAFYRTTSRSAEPVEQTFLATPEELAQRLGALGEEVSIFGQIDGADASAFQRVTGEKCHLMDQETILPDALAVAQLGLRRYRETGGDDIASLRPIYVRMSYAEERFDIDLDLR
jgi:tRNA threonylcarbamoyladenosine biosynthesis protein TsaB